MNTRRYILLPLVVLALLAACGKQPTGNEARAPEAAARMHVVPLTPAGGGASLYAHGSYDWTGLQVVDLGAVTDARVYVTGVITGNANEQSLNVLASADCANYTPMESLPVGSPTPSTPTAINVDGQDTDGAVRCVAIDGGDGFKGNVFLLAREL